MAKEYIERGAAKERLRIWITDCLLEGDNDTADCLRDCIDLLDSIPAADVAPVVRCKDCRWRESEENEGVCPYEDIRDFIIADDACKDCVHARPIEKLKYQHSCQYRNGPNCNLN